MSICSDWVISQVYLQRDWPNVLSWLIKLQKYFYSAGEEIPPPPPILTPEYKAIFKKASSSNLTLCHYNTLHSFALNFPKIQLFPVHGVQYLTWFFTECQTTHVPKQHIRCFRHLAFTLITETVKKKNTPRLKLSGFSPCVYKGCNLEFPLTANFREAWLKLSIKKFPNRQKFRNTILKEINLDSNPCIHPRFSLPKGSTFTFAVSSVIGSFRGGRLDARISLAPRSENGISKQTILISHGWNQTLDGRGVAVCYEETRTTQVL